MMLNKIAVQRPATEKPGTNLAVIRINKPLITKVNSPRVKILNGSVNRRTIGLIKVLTIPKTTATTMAVKKLSTRTPAKR